LAQECSQAIRQALLFLFSYFPIMTRAEFNRLSVALIYASLLPLFAFSSAGAPYKSARPPKAKRKFRSRAVDDFIEEFKKNSKDEELSWMFENCFPNTLDTTVFFEMKNGLPDTYVITGDIDAMWLRDSSAQVNPYIDFCAKDEQLSLMVEGLIRRQTQCILLDPYANAFYKNTNRISQWRTDLTEMKPGVHERKWELDSLCFCIRLAYRYWKATGNTKMFDTEWHAAMKLVVKTMKEQQRKTDKGPYHFERRGGSTTDTLQGNGYGNPCKPNGMVCSAFRNSDDACTYPFNIPENLFAMVSLRQLAEIIAQTSKDVSFQNECTALADEIDAAVQMHGVTAHATFGKIFAYECDGLGNYLLMDDAGVPGLVTIPYLGYGNYTNEIYLNSRKFALSSANPYFYQSAIAEGTGSPHLAWKKAEMIWHLGMVGRAITSTDDTEIKHCIDMLKKTHAGKGFMHEGFNKNNPNDFTRHWFAWANSFFGELILKLYKEEKL
jgi:meiotically up-regulated gene 157 (Mug157) protein